MFSSIIILPVNNKKILRKDRIYGGQKYTKIYEYFGISFQGDGQLLYDLTECGL